MIKRELFADNLYRTYSDEGFKIRQVETGIVFDDALDLESANYTYEETEDKIENNIETLEALGLNVDEFKEQNKVPKREYNKNKPSLSQKTKREKEGNNK